MITDVFTQYLPHGLVTALAGVAAYVFKRHDERDDARFDKVGAALIALNEKLDASTTKASDNHAEILKILLGANDRG